MFGTAYAVYIGRAKEHRMRSRVRNILVIDDCADDRLVTRRILEKNGFCVLEASNWMDALVVVGEGDVDLVLLDLKMPEMDGLELLGIIRKNNSSMELPIIVYTSSNSVKPYDCILKGSNDFVKKYGDPNVLIGKVKETLDIVR